MANDVLRYDRMVEDALRGVLREALRVSVDGPPGGHHFYITFRTRHPQVDIPDHIRARYPDEMTIVLQHQYWGLEVTPEWFEVTLSFNRVNERLHIPFAAVSAFADPSAKFGLQFQTESAVETPRPDDKAAEDGETSPQAAAIGDAGTDSPKEQGAQVIPLDAFRKK